MEEWVGQQWHRFITRAADPRHAAATVTLSQMQRSIGMLFRAGGGDATLRIAPAAQRRSGGPRGWLQKVAGSGHTAALPLLEPDVLSLPPEIAVFADAQLNRSLYLWLAALAAHWRGTGDWIADNLAASQAVLTHFPGLRERHAQLVSAHLAQRPSPPSLKADAALAEQQVQQALRGETLPAGTAAVKPADVAPVWVWLEGCDTPVADAMTNPDSVPPEASDGAKPTLKDSQRRHAQRVQDDRNKAPLVMFFRGESIFSWGEFIKVNRSSDEDDNPDALAVANDMDTLAVASDGQSAASRVKFDLDLPSAAMDDLPLGPGEKLPEWDWKKQRLLPDHCCVQILVTRTSEPMRPDPALRATARRVRRRLEVLRAATGRLRAQADGDEIDLDAWIRHRVDATHGPHSETPQVYTRQVRSERNLATLLLADLSLSTDAYASQTARVIDVIRDALYVFGEALTACGDPFEMLGFSSVRRQNVRIHQLKGFDEPWNDPVRARVGAIRPGYYTRMGAAIRHATQRLQRRPERQRLLLLLTDGKPNDLDVYEGRYGLEDTRHAVQAARAAGLTPFCVTIDETGHDYLPLLFGQQGYALVHQPRELVHKLTGIYASLRGLGTG